jgi:serine/threonine-protein kinase
VGPVPRDSADRADQFTAARAVAAWQLVRGDTGGVGPLLERLRGSVPAAGTGAPDFERLWLVALEALQADRAANPAAAQATARLDSMLAVADYTVNTIRFNALSLLAARLVEKYQSPKAALATVRRRAVWWNNEVPYLAAQLRETGRLAALAGEKEEAVAAYRHYLALRYDPEPEVRPEVDRVREELGKLEIEKEK